MDILTGGVASGITVSGGGTEIVLSGGVDMSGYESSKAARRQYLPVAPTSATPSAAAAYCRSWRMGSRAE